MEREGLKTGVKTEKKTRRLLEIVPCVSRALAIPTSIVHRRLRDSRAMLLRSRNNVFIAEVDKPSTVYEKASQFKRPPAFTAQIWLPRSRMVSGHPVP